MTAGHPISQLDPVMRDMVKEAMNGSVQSGTLSSYETGASKYMDFCDMYGLEYWPVQVIWLVAWMRYMASSIKISSLKMYMAGVRFFHESAGHKWVAGGHVGVRRMLRFLKRRFPQRDKGEKTPVTTQVLRQILPKLKGWPSPDDMSADDVMFSAASLVAVTGFLRGGVPYVSQVRKACIGQVECHCSGGWQNSSGGC